MQQLLNILVDLRRQLKFPDTIVATTLRPPEDRMEEAQERKRAKYASLVAECRRPDVSHPRWVAGALQSGPYTRSRGFWESADSRDREPSKISWKPRKRLPSGSGSRGVTSGLDTSRGLIRSPG